MSNALFYFESCGFCIIVFTLIFLKCLTGFSKSIHKSFFEFMILSQVLYMIFEILWAFVEFEVWPQTKELVSFTNVSLYACATCVGYSWFLYVEDVCESKLTNNRLKRTLWAIPLFAGIVLDMILFSIDRGYYVDTFGNAKNIVGFIILITVPFTYVTIPTVKTFLIAAKSKNRWVRKYYLINGVYPLGIIVFGALQVSMLMRQIKYPFLCFGSTILIIFLYLSNLDKLISNDSLTDLFNRRMLNKAFKKMIRNKPEELKVLMIDIDNFKDINDECGHNVGDYAIVDVCNALKRVCFVEDVMLCRYGGDEFIVLTKLDDNKIKEIIKSMSEEIAKLPVYEKMNGEKTTPLTVSIGMAKYDVHKHSNLDPAVVAVELVVEADKKLYKEKEMKKTLKNQNK